MEGTAASLVGSGVMALVMLELGLLVGAASWALVSAVGLVATLLESLIGAGLQQRCRWLSNELVNALQTAIAAALAMLAGLWLGLA